MTVGRARSILSFLWIGLSAPLIFYIIALTLIVIGTKGEVVHHAVTSTADRCEKIDAELDWHLLWSWLTPLVFPTLALIVGVWSVSSSRGDKIEVKSKDTFWGTIIISGIYFGAIYFVLALQPLTQACFTELLKVSGWFLGSIQTIAALALSKFFVENVHR
jgi:hypothetical protein